MVAGNDSQDHQDVKESGRIEKMKAQGQGQDAGYLTTQGSRSQNSDSEDFLSDER